MSSILDDLLKEETRYGNVELMKLLKFMVKYKRVDLEDASGGQVADEQAMDIDS